MCGEAGERILDPRACVFSVLSEELCPVFGRAFGFSRQFLVPIGQIPKISLPTN